MIPTLGRIVHVYRPELPGHAARWLAGIVTEEAHPVEGRACISVTVFPPFAEGGPYGLVLPAEEHETFPGPATQGGGYRWRWPPKVS